MLRRVLLSVCVLALVSCGSTFNVYKENIKLLFNTAELPHIDRNFVAASRFDIIQVDVNGNSAVMALAFAEQGQAKYISADNAVVVFAQGRIIRMSGLATDLLHTSNLAADPLQQQYQHQHTASWSYVVQTSTEPAVALQSRFRVVGADKLYVLDTELATVLLEETVSTRGKADRVNLYWYAEVSGELVQTVQYTQNLVLPTTVVFLSRINRLLASGAGTS